MKHRNSHFAVGYWSRLRRGRAVPDQTDIDPRALKRVLPIVFLLDTRPDGRFVYRLAGTGLCERYGTELRGLNFLSQWDADSRSRLGNLLSEALSTRAPICLTSIGATQDCRMVEIETVLMPITYGAGEPKHFLGIAQFLSDGAALAGGVVSFERLVSSSVVREDDGFSGREPSPERPSLAHPARGSHLRLVVS